MDIAPEEWFKVKDTVERLASNVFGNGKPALEVRILKYVDERDAHKEANARQDLLDLRHDMDTRHTENRSFFEKLSDKHDATQKLVYIGMGIMVALEAVGLFKK